MFEQTKLKADLAFQIEIQSYSVCTTQIMIWERERKNAFLSDSTCRKLPNKEFPFWNFCATITLRLLLSSTASALFDVCLLHQRSQMLRTFLSYAQRFGDQNEEAHSINQKENCKTIGQMPHKYEHAVRRETHLLCWDFLMSFFASIWTAFPHMVSSAFFDL